MASPTQGKSKWGVLNVTGIFAPIDGVYIIMILNNVILCLQMMTGLECGHRFCTQCWCEYLTTKIIEEGLVSILFNVIPNNAQL